MTQNTSHAVMQQRHEPHDSLDYFPTPAWATRALCEYLAIVDPILGSKRAWEPACGADHMVRPLTEYFETVFASDVDPRPGSNGIRADFLMPGDWPAFDWIITNPPFRLAEQFAQVGIDRAREGVALLVRTAFLEGVGRWDSLFSRRKPKAILQFTERVPMFKNRVDPTGSTATSYCWVVWNCRPPNPTPKGVPAMVWIPPCRKKLERPEDYAATGPVPPSALDSLKVQP